MKNIGRGHRRFCFQALVCCNIKLWAKVGIIREKMSWNQAKMKWIDLADAARQQLTEAPVAV